MTLKSQELFIITSRFCRFCVFFLGGNLPAVKRMMIFQILEVALQQQRGSGETQDILFYFPHLFLTWLAIFLYLPHFFIAAFNLATTLSLLRSKDQIKQTVQYHVTCGGGTPKQFLLSSSNHDRCLSGILHVYLLKKPRSHSWLVRFTCASVMLL